ncbi:MAG TPA: radical SAM protein [Steroidobacteraceae bacterium]|nr:radical SAM protein [Steroidobacteraceae bacterium]
MPGQSAEFDLELQRLPLVTLYLTERCNSRCITCDYWRHGRADLDLAQIERLRPSLRALQTQVVLISGGEPLMNPHWMEIAQRLRSDGLQLWLLTSGLSLMKHADRAAQLFQAITVSLDGTNRETYAAIRGLDAFDRVLAGIRAAADAGARVSVRVTLQRANYRQLPDFVEVARRAGAQQISFLAVDVANAHAFARQDGCSTDLSLHPEDLAPLAQILSSMERDFVADFDSGFIAESPRRLWQIHQYFSAVCALDAYPPVRCNVPEYSAVISATGRVSPCFFIPGPLAAREDELQAALNSHSMLALRREIRAGARPECTRCVCSLWREPDARAPSDFLLRRRANA